VNSRAFGNTGWNINEIGLGCWEFGGAIQLDGKPDGHNAGKLTGETLAAIDQALAG